MVVVHFYSHRGAFCLAIGLFILFCVEASAQDEDWIRGQYSLLFRSSVDSIFRGTDLRSAEDVDRSVLYNYLTVNQLKIYQDENLRITGSGSAWSGIDLNEQPSRTSDRLELTQGAIQIDNGDASEGMIRLGRIYNFRGLTNQRFDGGEIYYPITDWLDVDVYGGRRPFNFTEFAGDTWLQGGRLGLNAGRRSTFGFSWLLSLTNDQFDDQKIGGDWRYAPFSWLEFSSNWGYDLISSRLYEYRQSVRLSTPYELDFRFSYDFIVPGLLIPKSSIFSVFSLAEENSFNGQIIYHPGRKWTFIVDSTYIAFDNEGGQGGDLNFFTDENALDGGYQWRYGIEVAYRHNENDEVSVRFERMLEGNFGYTVNDLIRTDFDFRDFDPLNPGPENEGFAFGEIENGFSDVSIRHSHRWLPNLSHSFSFSYTTFDETLFLRRSGDESFTGNLTLNWNITRDWDASWGGRYISSLADQDELQYFTRITWRF